MESERTPKSSSGKAVKRIAIVVAVYVGIIVAFESLGGFFQPTDETTLVITTLGKDGRPRDRVLTRLESQGLLYVAANHWPRAWYHRALENPKVQVTQDGETANYVAVPVTRKEQDRVNADNRLGILFRIVTGFPPRYFFRLEKDSRRKRL